MSISPTRKATSIALNAKILVVEDDENILNLLSAYLESAGHDVVERNDGMSGYDVALADTFDICVFDVMLPNMSGMEIVQAMRAQGKQTPVVFLTALGAENYVLQGFRAGADDYVIKPFSPRELVVRIQAILRRSPTARGEHGALLEVGPLRLDLDEPICRISGQSITLTPYEHKILRRLLEQPQRTLSRGQLIELLYGNDVAVGPKAIDVHVHNLRTKLGDGSASIIETVRGFGYRLSLS
ncbi:response regulator transcription factor [Roseibium sp.]|uniref:response regulator transcription factor n=1 Tax=Roseibium sp. TaxID=1936156 RepID=UPI003B500D96